MNQNIYDKAGKLGKQCSGAKEANLKLSRGGLRGRSRYSHPSGQGNVLSFLQTGRL